MAKEGIHGEVVEVLEDEGPEEGEIEDDTSEEDNSKNYGFCPPISTQNCKGTKSYRSPSTSNAEVHSLKSQLHSEEKSDQSWGGSGRHAYKYYVTHEKPVRDPYSRLKKTDINSDHRGINFNELLVDYKTSKHGSEGNFHEKENRHYGKDVRLDSSRKHVSGVNDGQTEKIKRSRKRKHRRSPSKSPISSDSDTGRRRKEIRTSRPKRKKKVISGIRNHNESAAIFAKIRASKLGLIAPEEKQPSLEIINVVSEGEQQVTEINTMVLISENEGALTDMGNESQTSSKDIVSLQKDLDNCDNEMSCSGNDAQAKEMMKQSECKGEDDDDDVHQLRMLCLQSAFQAKCLERKRRGLVVKKQNKDCVCAATTCSSPDSILDNTTDLLEAAVEKAIASTQPKESTLLLETGQTVSYPSLSEVPLPPGEPQDIQSDVPSLAEDLNPVDMDLALTDEEENNKVDYEENGAQLESTEILDNNIKICRSMQKTRNIPVTIGRQNIKSRQRLANNNNQEVSCRSNLLEVKTNVNQRENMGVVASNLVTVSDLRMGSMIVLDEFGTCSSPEICTVLDEDQTFSETSDAKSDFVSHGGQSCRSGNDIDDEDEELLRARLLLDISSRHMKLETANLPSLNTEDSKLQDPVVISNVNTVVETSQNITTEVVSPIHLNGKNCNISVETCSSQDNKITAKSNMVDRNHKQQMLIAAQKQRTLASNQTSVTAFAKARLSKIANRGKYRRVNQNRLALVQKRPSGSLQVTVPGTATSANKVITPMPQQQDRIVICLGEDSDDSEEEKSNAAKSGEQLLGKSLETVTEEVKPSDSRVGKISADFEKSVDLFLKEVRSVQESKSEIVTTNKVDVTKKGKMQPRSITPKAKISVNGSSRTQAAKAKLKSVSGLTPQAVRHLPFTQQAEYHRLKMQISILEKRKAAQASAKNDQNIVIASVSNTVSEPLEQNPSSVLLSKEKNKETSTGDVLDSFSFVSSLRPKEPTNLVDKLNYPEHSLQSKDHKSDEEEDENLMREQLLKSRLHRKVAAAASASKTPLCNVTQTLSCETKSILNEKEHAVPRLINSHAKEVKAQLCSGDTNSKEVMEEIEKKEYAPSRKKSGTSEREELSQKILTTESEKKSPNDCDKETSSSKEENINKIGIITCNMRFSPVAIEINPSTLEDISQKGSSKLVLKSADESKSKNAIQTQDMLLRRVDLQKNSDVQEITPNAKTGTDTSALSQTSYKALEMTKGSRPILKPASNQDSIESNASQLKDLENQLRSERNAALNYLSELSQLLNKMEIEGERLKQKELAVKKLKAELSLAETSLDNQRIFMNQLAVNVSSTRQRVNAARHKCTLLTRACLKLGTQMKQEEVAQGGQKTKYQVPVGGAELVKSQLSKVLCHTKQLKKSGLPVFRLGYNSKEDSLGKKRVKRYLVQPQANTHWTKSSSDKSNAKVGISTSAHTSSKLIKHTRVGDISSKKPTSNKIIRQDATKSGSILQGLPPSKHTDCSPKTDISHNNTVVPAEINIKDNQISKNGSCISNVENGNVRLESSDAELILKKGVPAGLTKPHMKPMTTYGLLSTDASEKTSIVGEGNIALLKDYLSPLEPLHTRNCTESLTVADTRSSSKIESEDSLILDPNIILCPYDLMGVCEDEECSYQHQRRKGVLVAKS